MDFAGQFVPLPGIYLLNHSVGRPPINARKQLEQRFFDNWENSDEDVWPRWLEQLDGFRLALGRLLNGDAKDFCPQVNLSSALGKIVHGLPDRAGRNTILLHEQDFPSMGFVLNSATRLGWSVRMLPATADPGDIDTWKAALDEQVAVALVTHVQSNTSARLPVEQITALCRERDVYSIVDIAQSVGVIPIDLDQWQADFILGSCVKWLCGGPGAGFLWVRPALSEQCEPMDLGWFSHENPFEFDIHNFRYAPDAARFWGGTPSVLPYLLAGNSIEVLLDIGVDRIHQHNIELNDYLIGALNPERLVTPAAQSCRGGTLVVDLGTRLPEVAQRLQMAGVHFDTRSTGVRLSPHIYNSLAEMDTVRQCLAD